MVCRVLGSYPLGWFDGKPSKWIVKATTRRTDAFVIWNLTGRFRHRCSATRVILLREQFQDKLQAQSVRDCVD